MLVFSGRPTLPRLCAGVHKRTSLMSWFFFLKLCPTCIVRTWMVFEMRSKWLYSYCSVKCFTQDLFKRPHSDIEYFPSSYFFMRFVGVHVVHPYNSIDTVTAWKKFYLIDSLLIAFHLFTKRYNPLSVDEILLPIYVNRSINSTGLPLFV